MAVAFANQDLLLGYLPEFLDGELPAQVKANVESSAAAMPDVPVKFQTMRGRLQLALQTVHMAEAEIQELRGYVQDQTALATAENVKIEALGRGETISTLTRRIVLVTVALAIAAVAFWKFGPSRDQRFKALEYLGYEALALEEHAKDRINLPSSDIKEVRQYFATYPGLEFKPRVLKPLPTPWAITGATVIDYEVAKVAAVVYESTNSREKLFHFTYAGELSELPPAEPGNMRGLIFQTYASEELNLVAWQQAPGVVGLLVGRRSAPELAELAVQGTGTEH